jgi:hypothetical protein
MTNRLFLLVCLTALTVWAAGCGKEKTEAQNQDTATHDSVATPPVAQESVAAPAVEPVKAETPAVAKEEPKPREKPAAPKETHLTIPDSTQLFVSFIDSVQTNANQVGDHFKGKLDSNVTISGKVALPAGSDVDLVITKLVKGGTLKTPPEISFTVATITTPSGASYQVATSEVYEEGRSHTRREVGMIGGGAAAGAVIGAIAGKSKKAAAIGAVVGAAAGTGAAAATGRQNLVYGPGESVSFTTTKSVTVTAPAK